MKKITLLMALIFSCLIGYADETPSFPGGEEALSKYIKEHTVYPESAKENGVEGVVIVEFIVVTDGSLKDIKVIKLIDPDLESEALRVVKGMPAWIPAEKNGTPVEAPSKVNIPFILEE